MERATSEQDYNGWKNRETWNVALWFANEELYRAVLAHIRANGKFTERSAQDFVWNQLPDGTPDLRGIPAEVARSYAKVDWAAIAESFNEMASD